MVTSVTKVNFFPTETSLWTDNGSFMILFSSAEKAVKWCMFAQEALLGVDWNLELLSSPHFQIVESPTSKRAIFSGLRVQMGVVSGTATSFRPHPTTGRAIPFGKINNRAARFATAAHGGQIIVSQETVDSLESDPNSIQDKIIVPLGKFKLKGVAHPLAMWQISSVTLQNRKFPLPKTLGKSEDPPP